MDGNLVRGGRGVGELWQGREGLERRLVGRGVSHILWKMSVQEMY